MIEKKTAQAGSNPSTSQTTAATGAPEKALPADFSSFILSLATSALIHLGENADPATGGKSMALPDARQVIDLLTLLEDKTKGNLTKEEATLLSQLLFTLRMKFVAADKRRKI